jgi:N-acetylneuraminic acid mutarotase
MAVSGAGNVIVAAYGLTPAAGDTNVTRRYDIDADTWTLGSPAPLPVRSEEAYGDTGHGGHIYAIGGRPTATVGNRLERYTVETDTWTTLTPMPTARAAATVAVIGDALYVMGGRAANSPCAGPALATVERYDIDTDTWSSAAPLPAARSDFASVAVGGRIYVFGGCDGVARLSDVDVYDPVTDTWSTAPADLPGGPRFVLQAGRIGNLVYVIGGGNAAGAVTGLVEVYNVVKDTWSTGTPMPTPRGESGVYSHGGRIYIPGGATPAFGTSSAANEVIKR